MTSDGSVGVVVVMAGNGAAQSCWPSECLNLNGQVELSPLLDLHTLPTPSVSPFASLPRRLHGVWL